MTRAEKWLLAGLGLSLAINGLLAAMIFFHPGHHGGRHGPDVRVGRLEQHLSPESRDVLRAAVDRRRDELREEFRAMRDARDDIADALSAEPFDREALDAAFARADERQDAIRATIRKSFGDAAAKLPAEERAKLAKGGERYLRRLFGPRDGERDHGDRDRDGPPGDAPRP
jgi:uncharacterized membrane protein